MTTETLSYLKGKVRKAEELLEQARRIERIFKRLSMANGETYIRLSVVNVDGRNDEEVGDIVFDGASAEKVLALIEEEKQLLIEEYDRL